MIPFLQSVAARKRAEIAAEMEELPQHVLLQRLLASDGMPRRNLRAALSGRELRLIAELRRPPRDDAEARLMSDPRYIAQEFAGAGAAALSVVTDDPRVGTEPHLMRRARRYMALPVLQWDWFVDEYQVYQAWDNDADAVALVVGLVDDDTLQQMMRAARKLRMTGIPVVRDEFEVDSALAAEPEIIAVSNRDYESGQADLEVTERLAPLVPGGVLVVSARGIVTRADAERVAAAGADAALFEPPVDYELAKDAIRDLRGIVAPGRRDDGTPRSPEELEER
jgi:indole-3-glycerol phosphate synthase